MGRRLGIDKEVELPLTETGTAKFDILSRTILLLGLWRQDCFLSPSRSALTCAVPRETSGLQSIPSPEALGFSIGAGYSGSTNEHRIPIVRALIWIDTATFNGRNVSLFVEIWIVLGIHWAALCYVLERFTNFSTPLKADARRTVRFLHLPSEPNRQPDRGVSDRIRAAVPDWQLALLATAFFARLHRKWIVTFGLASAPVLAAWNMAGGFMIGPAVLLVGVAKRLPWRVIVIVLSIFSISAGAYFWGFKPPHPSHPPQAALADPKGLLYIS